MGTSSTVTVFHLPGVDRAGQAVQWPPPEDIGGQLQLIQTLLPGSSSGRGDLQKRVAQAGPWGLPLLVVHEQRVVGAVRLLRLTEASARVRPDEELARATLGCRITRRGSSTIQVRAYPHPPRTMPTPQRRSTRAMGSPRITLDAVKSAMDQPCGI